MYDSVTDFFGLPEDIAKLSGGMDGNVPTDAGGRVRLAWFLRQRNTTAALELLAAIGSPVHGADNETQRLYGRVLLIEAECARLHADLTRATSMLDQAEALFIGLDDPVGLGDCAFIRAEALLLAGEILASLRSLRDAVHHYSQGDDPFRQAMAMAWATNQEQYHNPGEAQARWDATSLSKDCLQHPAVRAYAATCEGSVAFQQGDFPLAIRIWEEGFEQARVAGAVTLAIHLATVTGSAYANLFDLPTALEWKERAVELAKSTGWPEALGATLSSMAETTTSLGQHDRAELLFQQALPYLDRLPGSRRHSIAYSAYGNLCIAMGNPAAGLEWYQKAETIAQRLGHPDVELLLGSAIPNALLKLGRADEAEQRVLRARALSGAQGNPYYEIEALRVLAAVRRAQGRDPSEAIALLLEALSLGEALKGMTIRNEIYEELARDYEAAGEFQRALHFERRARESWQRNFDRQNGARIQALQVRFDTARARSDAEHHRRLAEAEAARALELDRANQTLERLGSIGQEITARLDSDSVFDTLSRHLHDLMPANTLFLGLKDDARQIIDVRYRTEDGRRLPPRQVALASDNLSARCVRDNEEILVSWGSAPDTRPMRTVLFRPLAMGGRVLGVVSVQSEQPNAYGPRELLIFRTICAYGAIAMANAEAYEQLDRAVAETREALQRLVQQEKMAALGQLVAGVAHEVNTPLGVTLSAVSQLNDSIRHLREMVARGNLTRSLLTETLDNGQDLAVLAQRNVVRAADMIRTFKGVAVDHGNDERRIFDLDDYLSEIMSLIRARVAGNGNRIELDVAPVQMDTYPGALAQVITNLVTNVADHAYAPDRPGRILVRGRRLDSAMVEIAVEDQGVGIPADILPRVFDPFFTTRRASGSMGLGLHVAFNQVTQRLNGSITVNSTPGKGTVAVLRIPREVPGNLPSNFLAAPMEPTGSGSITAGRSG